MWRARWRAESAAGLDGPRGAGSGAGTGGCRGSRQYAGRPPASSAPGGARAARGRRFAAIVIGPRAERGVAHGRQARRDGGAARSAAASRPVAPRRPSRYRRRRPRPAPTPRRAIVGDSATGPRTEGRHMTPSLIERLAAVPEVWAERAPGPSRPTAPPWPSPGGATATGTSMSRTCAARRAAPHRALRRRLRVPHVLGRRRVPLLRPRRPRHGVLRRVPLRPGRRNARQPAARHALRSRRRPTSPCRPTAAAWPWRSTTARATRRP